MLVFVIQGYESKQENGQLMDVVSFEIIATNQEEAINRAKGLIDKPFYRVSAVIEKNA